MLAIVRQKARAGKGVGKHLLPQSKSNKKITSMNQPISQFVSFLLKL